MEQLNKDIRRWLAFGTGVGIEIGATDLEVVVARVRPSRIQVLGRTTIANFAARPAAEWGSEYTRFLKSLGEGQTSATVLLPRKEVIARQVSLPGVASKDIESAIRLQLDSLHPYGDDEVAWGWSSLGSAGASLRSDAALVGIARRETVERYHQLFTEAGIAVCSFTFSAAAVHAAIRLNGAASGNGFVALSRSATGAVEVYGESAARPLFSAEFDLAPQRAAVLALSELRLPPDTVPLKLEEVLPKPAVNPVTNDLSRNALPYATALAGACPRLAPAANVLPAQHRRSSSRAALVPTLALAAVVLLAVGAAAAYSSYADHQYLKKLDAEIAKIEPQAQRAAVLDRQIDQMRARVQLLDRFRQQTRLDLDALNEMTRLIEPPAWTNSIDLTRDTAHVSGEALQAAPLLKILDSSPFFESSGADSILRSPSGAGEAFQIHMNRRARK
ncbi:MAG TPA: pilus assembly protein PilM [Bryobacteraceae bacterium]|nr:pilus assembly protein PilM [Bryobacteraceae bacterium]